MTKKIKSSLQGDYPWDEGIKKEEIVKYFKIAKLDSRRRTCVNLHQKGKN